MIVVIINIRFCLLEIHNVICCIFEPVVLSCSVCVIGLHHALFFCERICANGHVNVNIYVADYVFHLYLVILSKKTKMYFSFLTISSEVASQVFLPVVCSWTPFSFASLFLGEKLGMHFGLNQGFLAHK